MLRDRPASPPVRQAGLPSSQLESQWWQGKKAEFSLKVLTQLVGWPLEKWQVLQTVAHIHLGTCTQGTYTHMHTHTSTYMHTHKYTQSPFSFTYSWVTPQLMQDHFLSDLSVTSLTRSNIPITSGPSGSMVRTRDWMLVPRFFDQCLDSNLSHELPEGRGTVFLTITHQYQTEILAHWRPQEISTELWKGGQKEERKERRERRRKEGRKEGREGRRKEGRKEGNKGGGGHGVWVLRSEREAEVPLGIMNNPVFLAEEVEIFPVGNR